LLDGDYKYGKVHSFGLMSDAYVPEKADDLRPMMVKFTYDRTGEYYGKAENSDKVFHIKSFDKQALIDNWNTWGQDAKNITALKASNIYNANMNGIKQRSLNIQPGKELTNEQINLLARVEHNRWNIEKLIMGYRACTPEEREKKTKKELRDEFKHKDIVAYQELEPDDKGIQANKYDESISRALPFMLSEYERLKPQKPINPMSTTDTYTPYPIDVSDIEISSELIELTERIAANVHDVWAAARIADGWSYGPARDDARRLHPCLVPYDDLPESEKEYDRNTAMGTLRVISKLGYEIRKIDGI
jgi:ryanodine receptor 2